MYRYGGSGVLRRETAAKLKENESLTFSGKAMLHLLRARLAPARRPPVVPDGTEHVSSKDRETDEDFHGGKVGALSKVFKLWNKDSTAVQSRAKKKLATVRLCCT